MQVLIGLGFLILISVIITVIIILVISMVRGNWNKKIISNYQKKSIESPWEKKQNNPFVYRRPNPELGRSVSEGRNAVNQEQECLPDQFAQSRKAVDLERMVLGPNAVGATEISQDIPQPPSDLPETGLLAPYQRFFIKGIGGRMNGQVLEVPMQKIRLGREPVCEVRYPENEPGVSRLHAMVENRMNRLYLTDMNSKYGTFCNGKKLQAGETEEIHSGDRFWLFSEQNMFQVETEN